MHHSFPLIGLLVLTGALCACEEAEPVDEPVSADAGRPENPAPTSFTLRVQSSVAAAEGAPTGPIRLLIEDAAGERRDDLLLADVVERWPIEVNLDALPDGRFHFTVYQDRDADGAYDGCPFPPGPEHTEQADRFDNLVGVGEVLGQRRADIEITLARSICGPGDAATGLSGQLIGPRGAALDGVPIFALFTPVEALRQVAQQLEDARPRPTALRVPVLPAGLLGGRAGFDVGELVPGIYRVQFFADEDGDHAPTPCGPDLGGGDRYVAEPIEVEVVAGVHAPLAAPIELRAGDCPDPLTGLRGTLALAPTLAEQWAADPSLVGPLGVLDGSVRLALVSPQGGVAVVNRTLLTGLSARPLPQPFTVTGVPPGIWRAQVFVDRDADGRFTRCSGWPAGLDAVFVQREEVRIRPGEVLDLGALVLERADCDDEPATGLRGALRLPAEAGAAGSGRAVRMELYPTDNRGERRGLLLFENHREATAGDPDAVAVFNRPVAPGAYRGVIFLDTDGDGAFTGCPLSPYGDRSAVETGPIEVVEGRLTDLGELTVAPLGCPVPPATLTPILSFDQVEWPRDVPLDLAMQVREAGGWSLEWSIGAVEPLAELTLDSLQLAPGRYEVTAFVDEDGDGQLDPCDADVPDRFVARTPLQLDEQMPAAQARLALQPACAR